MAFNINSFAGALKGDGARSSLFEVQITNPINGVADAQVPFLVKASSIPSSTLTPMPIKYFGREVKLAGSRTFEDWNVTVINDEDFAVRNSMEEWSNAVNSHQGNLRTAGGSAPSLYKSTAQITQFSKTGEVLRVYNFVGIFPTSIAAIPVGWDTEEIQSFDVTFAYDYWEVSGGSTGNAGGI
jgi:hypothetical protein